MSIWTTPATSPRPGTTDTALLLRYPNGKVVPVGVQSGHTAEEYASGPFADMDGYAIVGARQGDVTEYVERVIKIEARNVEVGDRVVMGDSWSFRVGSIDENRLTRGLRDERGTLWRDPSPLEEIKIQIAGEDPREGS